MDTTKKSSECVPNISEALREVMPMFDRMAEKTSQFATKLRDHLKTVKLETCDDHPDVELPVDFDKTFSESWFNKNMTVVYDVCPRCLEDRQKILVNERLKKMGIPIKVLNATFFNYDITVHEQAAKALKKVVSQTERQRGFLILRGFVGTGKSHLAAAALKYVSSGIFTTLADLIGELRNTYDEGGQEKMVERYRNAKCFVLDELTKEVKGSDVGTILYRILAHRYDRGSLTIITSNDGLDDILEILGPKLRDRIKEDYRVATMEWDSYRSKK